MRYTGERSGVGKFILNLEIVSKQFNIFFFILIVSIYLVFSHSVFPSLTLSYVAAGPVNIYLFFGANFPCSHLLVHVFITNVSISLPPSPLPAFVHAIPSVLLPSVDYP